MRRAAQYGCKYSQKDWSPEHVGPRNHRYEIAQGFKPTLSSSWVRDPVEAEGIVIDLLARAESPLLKAWDSNQDPDWNRVPVKVWRW
jgi:hypothetical protein